MRVIYIAGPFRADTAWGIEQNVRAAEGLALAVWRLGAAALCPHTNTRYFHNAAPDALWLEGDLAMLLRCDAVLCTPDWYRSEGARAEVKAAEAAQIPVFKELAALVSWLRPPPPESGRPCGCDPAAGWTCAQHRICECPNGHGPMRRHDGPLAPSGPIGWFWKCDVCEIERLVPDSGTTKP